ncbi:MAG: YdeI/OmpD-associated family protein [candidate division Zixibacteria bacterium]
MKITETLYVTNRDDWRSWLENYHKSKKEVWLIYFKKHTGKPRIPYDDAVEEALCFGWVDTTVQRIDDEKYAQRFTPRRKNSGWSELNIKRARKMIRAGQMTKAGSELYKKADKNRVSSKKKTPAIPPALKKALGQNKQAKKNFEDFAPSYRRNYINWINAAKRDETRQRRIATVVQRAASNIKPGML